MRRKLGFLAGLVIVAALVIGGMKFLGSRSPKQGELRVDSVPTVSVFLGNKHIGRTPFKEKIDTGEYTIKLVPESTVSPFASWQGNISVSPNLLTYVNANLSDSEFMTAVDVLSLEKISSKLSELSVTTNPDGATVSVDGETRGITPLTLTGVSAGEHTLMITSPGFVARQVKAKTTAGYKLNAAVKLALSSEGVSAEATPSPTVTVSPTAGKGAKPTPGKVASPSATGVTPPKPYAVIKDTPTGFLRVRMEPSTSSTEAARVNPGDKFTILDSQGGWYKIKYDDTNIGWISGQYAEKVE